MKRFSSNLAVQLRESAEEALKDMPGGNSREVSRAELRSINDRPFSRHPVARVLLLARIRIEATSLFFGVGKAHSERLGKEQQVRHFAP